MTLTHIKRLEKLAAHLEHGKLEHKKFNFAHVNCDEFGIDIDQNGCGYGGCAIGELPAAFPKEFKWKDGWPVSRSQHCNGFSAAMLFFGLHYREASHLFVPSSKLMGSKEDPDLYGGRILGPSATRKQVATNIRAFIRKKLEAK